MFAAGEALTRIAPDISDTARNSGLAYLVNIILTAEQGGALFAALAWSVIGIRLMAYPAPAP